MRDRSITLAATLVAMGCAGDPNPGDEGRGTTTVSATEAAGAGAEMGGPEPTGAPPTGEAEGEAGLEGSSSSGDPPPVGPPCSVQVVTEGALYEPLERGEVEGMFPTPIARVLEDNCGCHTLEGGAENLAWPGLQAPSGTNFLTYADLDRPLGAGTLGMAMQEVVGAGMPPGSCGFPIDARMLLDDWFDQGLPDGASYVP